MLSGVGNIHEFLSLFKHVFHLFFLCFESQMLNSLIRPVVLVSLPFTLYFAHHNWGLVVPARQLTLVPRIRLVYA